jgi:hypothetical protein
MALKKNSLVSNDIQKASGWFFFGYVRFISQGFLSAKYSITENGSIIKVKNSAHVRMINDQFGKFPDEFQIVAPTEAVTEITGEVPDSYNKMMRAIEYVVIQNRYQKKFR